MTREQRLTEVFVEITHSLVDEFDVVDVLQTLVDSTVELLNVDAAALMLSDQRGELRGMASSSEQARLLDLVEIQSNDGPCIDSFHSGEQVLNVQTAVAEQRWPIFTPAAVAAGFGQTHALPLRLRGQVIGALNLLTTDVRDLTDQDVIVGQALCDIATVCILQDRAVHEHEVVAEQLQGALNTRILIEQATGVLAERTTVSTADAFAAMRAYARRNNLTLRTVADSVIDGTMGDLTLASNVLQAKD